jgi:hypothetical protein
VTGNQVCGIIWSCYYNMAMVGEISANMLAYEIAQDGQDNAGIPGQNHEIPCLMVP